MIDPDYAKMTVLRPYQQVELAKTGDAEKRAKDRVILKLLNIHGVLYSEEEADDFKRQDKAAANDQPISDAEYASLMLLIDEANADADRFTRFMDVADLRALPKARFKEAVAALNAKKVRHVA